MQDYNTKVHGGAYAQVLPVEVFFTIHGASGI
jgi:hypothetical protein